jgi:DNA-binding response OmpR family regulator
VDTGRLARVVEDVIRALDPALAGSRIEVEVTRAHQGPPTRPAAVPTLTADPRTTDPRTTDPRTTDTAPGPLPDPTSESPSDLALDLAGRTLTVDGRVVTLTRREFELLAYLQDRRGVALSRRELMTTVWQSGYLVGDRTIDVHVRRLRVKLGRHADRLSTLRGYGYRLE